MDEDDMFYDDDDKYDDSDEEEVVRPKYQPQTIPSQGIVYSYF